MSCGSTCSNDWRILELGISFRGLPRRFHAHMVKQMPGNRVVLISLLQLRKSTLYPGPDSFPEYTGYGGCMEEPKLIKVVGAAIIKDGKVLCAQRGAGKSLAGYWEFPGGKIEAGETPQQALQREIEEELLCEIDIDQRLPLRFRQRATHHLPVPSHRGNAQTYGT